MSPKRYATSKDELLSKVILRTLVFLILINFDSAFFHLQVKN